VSGNCLVHDWGLEPPPVTSTRVGCWARTSLEESYPRATEPIEAQRARMPVSGMALLQQQIPTCGIHKDVIARLSTGVVLDKKLLDNST
jgi:hypothetical protein